MLSIEELRLQDKYLKEVGEWKTVVNNLQHKLSLIPYYGGKYYHIEKYLPYIYAMASTNECHTYAELAGGGARFLLNIDNDYFVHKVYNELDLGLSSLFQCVKSMDYKVLMEVIEQLESSEEVFQHAVQYRSDSKREILELALYTYVVAKRSYNAEMKSYKEMELEINTKSIEKAHKQLDNTIVLNGDFKSLLRQWGTNQKILKLIDPPYHPITRSGNKADSYCYEMTAEEHRLMIRMLCKCNSWILCGYDPVQYGCDDYKPLEEVAMKISMGKFELLSGRGSRGKISKEMKSSSKEEFIWIHL